MDMYGPFVSEEKCRLFGDVSGKRMLEIGCGNVQSLQYHGDRKAAKMLPATFVIKARKR